MTNVHDPLRLPCGLVLPNRLMKAALSEALANRAHSPDTRLERLYRTCLSPLTNLRDDEWGGDPRRRMRFLLEIVRRIRARVSPGFAVSVKLNSAGFQRGGFSEDESRDVVAAL